MHCRDVGFALQMLYLEVAMILLCFGACRAMRLVALSSLCYVEIPVASKMSLHVCTVISCRDPCAPISGSMSF
jgi:hypothetical protein